MMKKWLFYILLIIFLIWLDQYTKYVIVENFRLGEVYSVIDGLFNLTYVKNSGAAFGFGGAFSIWIRYTLFLALPVIACIWLVLLLKQSLKKDTLLSIAYALIIAGAIGNLIDRFRLGYVVDFFDFYVKTSHFATFNVADSAISVAAGLLVIDFFLKQRREKLTASKTN